MATIDLDRVTKVFGNGFRAVDDVSPSITDGEFIVLVGPSGCGKSTLLRMVAGLEEVTAGDGRIVQVDTPQALYHAPHDVFVAAFIGSPSMNLVEATLDDDVVRFGGHAVPLGVRGRPREANGRVVLGVRPEAFEDGALAASHLPRLRVRVDVLEELGAETHAYFRVNARRPDLDAGLGGDDASLLASESTLFTARLDARTAARQGTTIEVAVDPERLHFFDPRDGSTLGRPRTTDTPATVAVTSGSDHNGVR